MCVTEQTARLLRLIVTCAFYVARLSIAYCSRQAPAARLMNHSNIEPKVCCNMRSIPIPLVVVAPDSTHAVEQSGSAVDASIVTLPASRPAVDARGLALGVLAALALVYALSWARAFAIPLLLGIVISYTLYPLVAWLEAIRIPRVVGTVVVMAGVISALAFGMYSLRGQMQTIIGQLPEAATKLSAGIAGMRIGQIGDMQKMQNAADTGGKSGNSSGGRPRGTASSCHSRYR